MLSNTYYNRNIADVHAAVQFVAVGSNLPPLDWTRFPPTSIDRNSSYPLKIPKEHYFQLNLILPLVTTKYLRGFFAKNTSTLRRPLSSIFNLSLRQGLALRCGNHLMFHQYQNLPPLKTSTQVSSPSPSRPLLAKFKIHRFLAVGFSNKS